MSDGRSTDHSNFGSTWTMESNLSENVNHYQNGGKSKQFFIVLFNLSGWLKGMTPCEGNGDQINISKQMGYLAVSDFIFDTSGHVERRQNIPVYRQKLRNKDGLSWQLILLISPTPKCP